MDNSTPRPRSIAIFEQLYLMAIAIEVGRIVIDWPVLQASVAELAQRVAAVVISLTLLLLASRYRRRVAGLMLAGIFLVGLPMAATAMGPGTALEASLVTLLQVVLQAVALVYFFKPLSREWFARVSPGNTDTPA